MSKCWRPGSAPKDNRRPAHLNPALDGPGNAEPGGWRRVRGGPEQVRRPGVVPHSRRRPFGQAAAQTNQQFSF